MYFSTIEAFEDRRNVENIFSIQEKSWNALTDIIILVTLPNVQVSFHNIRIDG